MLNFYKNFSIGLTFKFKVFVCFGIFTLALAFFTAPFSAMASSVGFQNNVISVERGKTFTVPVSINPGNEKNYTARLAFTFSPQLLEVVSFTFAQNWIPLTQAGYDAVDNQAGEIIKTAGYPAGFSQTTAFGTLTFRAKQAGQDAVALGIKSFVLNARSEISLESRPQIAVAITEPAQAGQVPPQVEPPIQPLEDLPVPEQTPLFDIEAAPASPASQAAQRPYASIAIFGIIAAAILAAGYIAWKRHPQKNKQNNGINTKP